MTFQTNNEDITVHRTLLRSCRLLLLAIWYGNHSGVIGITISTYVCHLEHPRLLLLNSWRRLTQVCPTTALFSTCPYGLLGHYYFKVLCSLPTMLWQEILGRQKIVQEWCVFWAHNSSCSPRGSRDGNPESRVGGTSGILFLCFACDFAHHVLCVYFESTVKQLYLVEFWIIQLQPLYIVVSTLILDVHTIIIKFAQFHNVILGGHKMRVFRSATGLVKGGLDRKTPACACT
jgi:hypothetical protein